MASETKNPASSSEFEVDSSVEDLVLQSKSRGLKMADAARSGLTVLTLLCAITVLGVSGDALGTYNSTYTSADWLLPLWPDEFDVSPTQAILGGSLVVVVVSIVSLVFSKVPSLQNCAATVPLLFVLPLLGLVASIAAMGVFYSADGSATSDTLQSWSCRWEFVQMRTKPHYGTLCKETRTALYLTVALVPLQAVLLAVSGWQVVLARASGKAKADSAHAKALKAESKSPSI